MKKLIVSMKPLDDMFSDFKRVATNIKKGKGPKSTHYEISFESESDFNKFIKNIKILMAILHHKPESVYELSKLCNQDLANLKKVLKFFEDIGALQIEHKIKNGRKLNKPIVDYSKIEFDLKAA